MYLGFYGLAKEPFHITPDPDFLFLSPSHKEAFGALIYGIEQRKGFVALTGEVGTGKTTILRAYLKRIEKSSIRPIYLFNPDLTFEQLLASVLKAMGIEPKQKQTVPSMLERLHWALIHEYRQVRNVALIIDEAQNMPVETLEKLRMLSNLETTSDKLIQIVLVGQPELEKKLRDYSLRQLNQRIAVRAKVKALTRRESEEYVQHRLTLAGCARPDVFSRSALRLIIRRAKGNPRVLNIVCDNALANGFGHQAEIIGPKIVKEVMAELKPSRGRVPRWAWAAGIAAVLAVVSTVYWQSQTARPGMSEPQVQNNIAHASAPAPPPTITTASQESRKEESNPVAAVIPQQPLKEESAAAVSRAPAKEERAPEAAEQDPAKIALEMMQKAVSTPVETPKTSAPETPPAAVAATTPDIPVSEPSAPMEPPKVEETVVAKISEPAPAPDSTPAAPAPEVEQPEKAAEAPTPLESPAPAKSDAEEKAAPVKVAEAPLPEAEAPKHEEPIVAPVPAESPAPSAESPEPAQPQPAAEVKITPVADGAVMDVSGVKTRRLIVRGDSLSKLVAQLYGRSSEAMIQEVQKLNPQIQDPDMIIEGDTLVFPVKEDAPKNVESAAASPQESSNTVLDRSNP
ncbi:MAG TPA: AAA family ATPase [Candidatus Hydrogenedentes bacterium]|nr:AAA family ATPase [Candidatus Hydrogenedentota bacterium]